MFVVGYDIQLGTRTPSAPQVLRDRKRPLQPPQRILILPSLLSDEKTIPQTRRIEEGNWHVWSGERFSRSIPEKVRKYSYSRSKKRYFEKILNYFCRYYWLLFVIVFTLLPINAPAEYWKETILISVITAGFLRYGVLLNLSFLVHSATKVWGLEKGEK